jgi:hypothetical protein
MTTPAARARAAQATDKLTVALLTIATQGLRPRCGDHETSYLWLSEFERERKQAARLCAGCPVLEPCREVGRYQTFGVFGGVDATRTPGRKKAA